MPAAFFFASGARFAEQDQQRPTLNRRPPGDNSPSPTPAPGQSAPSATPASPSPSATPDNSGQPGQPVTYPKPTYPDLLPRFDYDTKTGLDLREVTIEKRGDSLLIEINFAGAGGDRVPGYLVIPHGKGPFAGIIWGHWLKQGSPLANKDEFLAEALALARTGVVSLLIDAPAARHEHVAEKDPLAAARQEGDDTAHQVIDLRRAVDLMLLRRDVDRKRIAYVGHSWDANAGAILAGVDIRICCYVLMAGNYGDFEDEAFASKDPERVARIKQAGEDNVREYFHEYAFADPVYFLGHTNNEAILLQFSSSDLNAEAGGKPAPGTAALPPAKALAQKYLDGFSSQDKQMQIYEADHALNAAARLDRDRWLQKHLGLKKVDEKELEAIPQLK